MATCRQKANEKARIVSRTQPLLGIVAAAAVAMTCVLAPPAWSEIQTVAPKDATSFARELPKQKVNKTKIWGIFLLAATGLFGAAVAVERNSRFFPAIAKANQALAATKAAQKKKAKEDEAIRDVQASEARAEDAVLEGLNDARSRVQESTSSSKPQGDSASANGSGASGQSDSNTPSPSQPEEQGSKEDSSDTRKPGKITYY